MARPQNGLVQALLARERLASRAYLAALLVAAIESAVWAPGDPRWLPVVLGLAFAPAAFVLLLVVVGLQVVANPLWDAWLTRGVMGFLVVAAPLAVGVALVLHPVAPAEIRAFGNGGATGWVGWAWAAHFLYRRHGLGRAVSAMDFWRGVSH